MIVSTIESNGDYKLHIDDNNNYLVEGPDGQTYNLFAYGRIVGPNYDPRYAGVQFEERGDGTFVLLWERLNGSGNATWCYEFTEFNGDMYRSDEYAIRGPRLERTFEVDLDGDGIIGQGLVNGDFIDGLTGWDVLNPTGGAGPVDRSGSAAFNASNETVYGDGIQQTVDTSAGQAYELKLDLIESDPGVSTHTALIEVIDRNGNVIASTTASVNNDSVEPVTLVFVANGISTIRITNSESTNSINTDLRIDNVSLMGVELAETPPEANDDANGPLLASALVNADGGFVKINGENVLNNDTDLNGDTLSIVTVAGEAVTEDGWLGWFDASNGGQIAMNSDGRVQFRDADGEFANLPAGEQVETAITYVISDGNGGTSEATVSFTIDGTAIPGPNEAPVAEDDANAPIAVADLTNPDGSFDKINGENVLANDTDANGDQLTIVEVGGEAVADDGWLGWFDASNGGQIAMNADGRVQFRDRDFEFADLAPGEAIDTSVLYTVSDGNGGTDTAEVTFTITGDGVLDVVVDGIETLDFV